MIFLDEKIDFFFQKNPKQMDPICLCRNIGSIFNSIEIS